MKKLTIYLVLAALWLNFPAGAQRKPISRGLQPGDQVPDITLPRVLGQSGAPLRLASFRGKLLILDFWATSCGACIEAMPRLDSLQQRLGDRLVILPVTYEKADRILAFQRRNDYLRDRRFLTVVGDTALHRLFPHRLLPHEVWISPEGRVLGFTEVSDITETHVIGALASGRLDLVSKADVLDYDATRPLLVGGNGAPDTAYRYRSLITAEIKGLPAGILVRYDSLKKSTLVRATNVSLRRLYTLAFPALRSLPDTAVSLGPDRGLWCYELDLPGRSASRIRGCIRQDLDRFFNLRSEFTGSAFRLVPADEPAGPEPPFTL